jgi:hypothetical protein
MTSPTFKLLTPKNNVTTPTLVGAIGASDTTIALTAGQGANFPTITRVTASSTGDARTLNSTGNLAGVSLGQWLYNLTDGSWAVCTATGTNSITTTPLEGGSLNVWTSGDVVVLAGMFIATITQFDAGGDIVKQERILVTNRSTDTLTVVRGLDSDTGLAFSAGDFVQILMEEHQIENIHYAIRNILGKIDALNRGVPFTAATTGSSNAYAITLAPVITSYASIAGMAIVAQLNFANTGAATLNVNGLGAKNVKKNGGSTAMESGDMANNMPAILIYNASLDCFVMVNAVANAPSAGSKQIFGNMENGFIHPMTGAAALATYSPASSIAFDAETDENGASASANPTYTKAHTCTGSNRILFVGVSVQSTTDDLTGITYNGVAMTRMGARVNGIAGSESQYLYMLVNPASGSNNVVFTCNATRTIRFNIVSYTGAHQSNQPSAGDTGGSGASTSLALTSTQGEGSPWFVMFGRNDTGNYSAGTNTTIRGNTSAFAICDTNGTATRTATMTSGSGKQSGIICAINPASDYPDFRSFDFDQTTPETIEVIVQVPDTYTAGGFTAKVHWSTTAGSGDVIWKISLSSLGDNTSLATAWGTAVSVTDTSNGANKRNISDATSSITPGGSVAAGQLMAVRITRDASNASDTLAADARLEGIVLTFT